MYFIALIVSSLKIGCFNWNFLWLKWTLWWRIDFYLTKFVTMSFISLLSPSFMLLTYSAKDIPEKLNLVFRFPSSSSSRAAYSSAILSASASALAAAAASASTTSISICSFLSYCSSSSSSSSKTWKKFVKSGRSGSYSSELFWAILLTMFKYFW